MASLYTKVKLYLEANSKTWEAERNNILLQDDGSGAYINTWNVSGLSKPTDTQLNSYETAGNTEEANNVIIAQRKKEYGSWESQLEEIYDNGIDAWKTRIAQVKTDNPKE
jgi:hypothetical protein